MNKGKRTTKKASKAKKPAKVDETARNQPKPHSSGDEVEKDRDTKGRFKPGHKKLGGIKKGSKHKWTRQMLDQWRERQSELADRALEAAIEQGDMQAMRLIVDRLVARADSQPISWKWRTELKNLRHVAIERRAILNGITSGELTPGQAKQLGELLDGFAESIREALKVNVRQRFERDQALLQRAMADPECRSLASQFIARVYSLELTEEAMEHPTIALATAVTEGKPN